MNILEQVIQKMRIKRYSANTINTYVSCLKQFFNYFKIGAGYTLIITPRYVPSVLTDIEGDNVSVLLASTFTEYLYQLITSKDVETDYSDLHNLILSNTGKDISALVSDLTFEKFAS